MSDKNGPPSSPSFVIVDMVDWFPRANGTITGRVFNHPKYPNGEVLKVTPTDFVSELYEGITITSKSLLYRLKSPIDGWMNELDPWRDTMYELF